MSAFDGGPSNPFHLKISSDPPPGHTDIVGGLQKFFSTPLGGAVITLICSTLAGAAIGHYFSRQEAEAKRQTDRASARASARTELVRSFAKMLATRKVAASLVWSGYNKNAPKTEQDARWATYQAAYLAYNQEDFAFKASMSDLLGYGRALMFIKTVDSSISPSFRRIDECLTTARFRTSSIDRATGFCPAGDGKSGWLLQDQLNTLQGCIATVEGELISLSYVLSNFDELREARKHPSAFAFRDALGAVVTMPASAVNAGAASKLREVECSDAADWACERARETILTPAKLDKGCSALADSNFSMPDGLKSGLKPAPAAGAARLRRAIR